MASIKGVSISDLQQMETSRGIAYNGLIYIDGKKVGMFENRGDGGCTSLQVPRQIEEEIEKRSLQYYVERPAEFDGVESFVEELINYYEYQESFEELQKKEPQIALGLVYSHARTDDTSDVNILEDLIPKQYKVPASLAMAFVEKHGRDKSEVFTTLKDFDIYPYKNKRLPIPACSKGDLLLQDLEDEKEYFYQDSRFSDVLYQGITVKCTTLIIKQTHVGATDDTTIVFDLSTLPLLSSFEPYKHYFKGEQYGKYTLQDLFAIAYTFQKIRIANEPFDLNSKVKLYQNGELIV